ncbi:GNAT family N-acetyltransferase [bacterium]|nr:GNAT family N-acetyltransferase [bacterium]
MGLYSSMNSIFFGASFLSNTHIQAKKKFRNKYEQKTANIVEIDPKNPDDKEALHEVSKKWDKQYISFAWNIYNDAVEDFDYPDVKAEHFLALTTQKNNFDKLNPDKVLGLALVSERAYDDFEINWLQVEPNNNSVDFHKNRQYKQVGRAMMNYICKTYSDKPIVVNPANTAVEFYKKYGFTYEDDIYRGILCYRVS